tara:strand:+ start:1669 stop:1989 length:321 start_codon:yes stop_codon:yes gene_type:complete
MKKVKVAKTIERFIRKHNLDSDVRIYFSNKCWQYDSSGKKTILEDIKASDYFRWANDDTISMSFEGALNHALNMYNGSELYEKFNALDFDGYYFELGNAWNLAFHK